jgi:hypothetical protein
MHKKPKRTKKPITPLKLSVDSVAAILRFIIEQIVHPDLLKKNQDFNKRNLDFTVARNLEGHIVIELTINHGPFIELKRVQKEVFVNDCGVTDNALVNLVLNSLTFSGSPFYLTRKGFCKSIQLCG